MSHQVSTSVKSANRVLDVFETLGAWDMGMTHSMLAEHLAIPKSSLTQLLKTMVQRGYIRFNSEDRTYHIGQRIETLAGRKREVVNLTNIIQPFLERITADTGESTFFNLLSGDMAQLTARVIGPQPLVTVLTLGQMVPLYATAGARAILAFLPEEMREDYLERTELKAFTPNTVTSTKKLRQELDQIRRERICVSSDELFLGITGIAMPVLSGNGHALGSVVVSMPTMRFNKETRAAVANLLREHINMLQAQLAGSMSPAGAD